MNKLIYNFYNWLYNKLSIIYPPDKFKEGMFTYHVDNHKLHWLHSKRNTYFWKSAADNFKGFEPIVNKPSIRISEDIKSELSSKPIIDLKLANRFLKK